MLTRSESSGGEDSSQSEDEGEGEVVRKKAKVSRGKEREDQLAKLLKVHRGGEIFAILSLLRAYYLCHSLFSNSVSGSLLNFLLTFFSFSRFFTLRLSLS